MNYPPVVQEYEEDEFPHEAKRYTELMLSRLPEGDVQGIASIQLRLASKQNRAERRRTTKSRGRKVRLNECLGFYQPKWKGNKPFIVLYVDRILRRRNQYSFGVRMYKRLVAPFRSRVLIAKTLYHEVGHHYAKTRAIETREPENNADSYMLDHLFAAYRAYWYLMFPCVFALLITPSSWLKMFALVRSLIRAAR